MRTLLTKLWNTNPLYIIGGALLVQMIAIALGYLPTTFLPTMFLVMGLAYLQNTTYGLQSRSANRNSNTYHLIAAVAANFTFFWSLKLLVRNELPPVLLAPYVFATILGTLHGNTISIKIESMLGIRAGDPKGRPQLLKLWPTVAVLLLGLGVQTMLLAPSYGRGILLALLGLTIVESFAFALLRVARSTDHYWFHFGAVVFNLGIGFLKFMIMVNNRFDWALFLPTATGAVIGSLVGANLAQNVGKRIKAAFDAHMAKEVKVTWPIIQLAILAAILVPHTIIFGVTSWTVGGILLMLCMAQAVSFTLVSRARQRNNAQYLAWTSVFSNGVWFLTMHWFATGKITLIKAAPYIVGNASGSLIGQNLAMHVERATGALMDEPTEPVPSVVSK